MKLGLTIFAVGLLLLPACAVKPTEFSRSGFYVGASLIGAASNFEDIDKIEDLDKVDYTAGIGLRGGYRFLDRFAIELAYQGAQEWRDHDVKSQSLALQGKFYPLTGAVQPYGYVGVGMLDVEVGAIDREYTGGLGRLGLGLEMYILPFLPLFLELEYTVGRGSTDDYAYWDGQVGVLFRF